jgi:hypothetical protein
MERKSDEEISLFVRDRQTGRFLYNAKALQALGINPAEAQRPFRNSLSAVQLIEQRLCLLQIKRVKALSEPAVTREQVGRELALLFLDFRARGADRVLGCAFTGMISYSRLSWKALTPSLDGEQNVLT